MVLTHAHMPALLQRNSTYWFFFSIPFIIYNIYNPIRIIQAHSQPHSKIHSHLRTYLWFITADWNGGVGGSESQQSFEVFPSEPRTQGPRAPVAQRPVVLVGWGVSYVRQTLQWSFHDIDLYRSLHRFISIETPFYLVIESYKHFSGWKRGSSIALFDPQVDVPAQKTRANDCTGKLLRYCVTVHFSDGGFLLSIADVLGIHDGPQAASLPSYGGRSDDASIGSRPPVVDGKAFFRWESWGKDAQSTTLAWHHCMNRRWC